MLSTTKTSAMKMTLDLGESAAVGALSRRLAMTAAGE
jgi:hypothetical protein